MDALNQTWRLPAQPSTQDSPAARRHSERVA
jgi:hypothetical protein